MSPSPSATPGPDLHPVGARVVLRPIGNPLPLGFLALAGGTLVLSGLQLGWVPQAQGRDVALILLAFVLPLQVLAAIFGFLARDVVAGTGMGVLAGTWASVGLVTLTADPGSTSDALGLLLLLAAVAMLVPAAAAATGKLVVAALLTLTAARFATTGIYQLDGSSAWKDVCGVIGLVLCAAAVYTALAMALEDARRRTVLPLGRVGTGRDALSGDAAAQFDGVQHEAGVREQL
ncbi:GPR1/FUN34/YaaH family transporter [Patulibacter sp. NPDC049589]|uniref:GPR1/FUN34/YaaH family transporter n=1 Tax=Patulibacter sp. NPDC049589 TaxID=3154731 RepID=UPI00341AC3E4